MYVYKWIYYLSKETPLYMEILGILDPSTYINQGNFCLSKKATFFPVMATWNLWSQRNGIQYLPM